MESPTKKKVELLQMAIKKLIDEEKSNESKKWSSHESFLAVSEGGDETGDNRRLLSKLLSQLQSLEDVGMVDQPRSPADAEKRDSAEVDKKIKPANESSGCNSEVGAEEIVKELKKVRRQNTITHCLLTAMIVLTVAWQLSEVSLILKVQEGLSHPFRSLGSIVSGMLKNPGRIDQEGEKASSAKQKPIIQASSLPGLRIPELPRVELPVLDIDHDEE